MTQQTHTLVEIDLEVPPDRVWRALREPAEIRRWFGWDHPTLDQEIEAVFRTDVEASESQRTLRIVGVHTTFSVHPGPRGSVLKVTKAHGGPLPDHDEIDEGWIAFAHQLRLALLRHPGEDRRSLHHAAPLRAADSGAATAAAQPIPGPEALSGSPWFRTPHQQGWLIPAWGDGLLIVHRFPPGTDGAPSGKRSVLITTYGMTPAAFEELRSRWTTWNQTGR